MNSISSSASVCFGVGIVYREGFWEQGVFWSFSAWFIFLGPAWRDSVVRSCVFFPWLRVAFMRTIWGHGGVQEFFFPFHTFVVWIFFYCSVNGRKAFVFFSPPNVVLID